MSNWFGKVAVTSCGKGVTTMTDNKLTDNEIIQALKCCIDDTDDICKKCPLYNDCEKEADIKQLALNLILKQQKQIEEYKAGVKKVEQEFKYWQEQRKALEG